MAVFGNRLINFLKNGQLGPLGEGPYYTAKNVYSSPVSQPSPKELTAFNQVTVHWGKGNNQTFPALLDTGSELRLISGDPHAMASCQSE